MSNASEHITTTRTRGGGSNDGKQNRNRRRFSLPFPSSSPASPSPQQNDDTRASAVCPQQQRRVTAFAPSPQQDTASKAVLSPEAGAAAAEAAMRAFSDAAKKALLVARVGEESEKEHKFVEAVQAYVHSVTLFHRLIRGNI